MKKVVLGLLALSAVSFGSNPGEANTASVPVRVIAELITAPAGLVITDEAGTVLDELVLDHGKIIQNTAQADAEVSKFFKVKRYTGGISDDIGIGKLNISLTDTTTTLKKGGIGSGDTDSFNATLSLSGGETQIDSIEYEAAVGKGDKEHMGRVTSTIAKSVIGVQGGTASTLETGLYHNLLADTLTVVYTAN